MDAMTVRTPTEADRLEVLHLGAASSLTVGLLMAIPVVLWGGSVGAFLAGLTFYMWVAYAFLRRSRRRKEAGEAREGQV
jgi:hypothetical protein